jgi:O-antigen/teichoic acid export membrane protein
MSRLREWLLRNRTSVRIAFVLRIFSMAVSSLMSLGWTRLLLHAMGKNLYGLFYSFQAVPQLGGLGDFGVSGAVAVRAGQMMGRKEFDQLRPFLAATRTLFLLLPLVLGGGFFALSHWLPQWLHFRNIPGAGSLAILFDTGAISLFLMVAGGYFHSVNSAYGTVTWPVLPTLLFSQLAMGAHWLVACSGAPLWMQNIPYLVSSALNILAVWFMLKAAHPWLGELRPLKIDLTHWRYLLSASVWVYLYSLGYLIYTSTDQLVINAGFGPALIPMYMLNYKLCDLTVRVMLSASFVSMPKITQWIASPERSDRERVLSEMNRLNIFQILLGCSAALGYLVINDFFIRFWVGPEFSAPALWQFAFALNMAHTAGSQVSTQVAGLCGRDGLRKTGIAIGGTGLLNLALSLLSMKLGSIAGIAFATVLAQSVLTIVLGWQICRYLDLPLRPWLAKSWLVPFLVVGLGFGLRTLLPPQHLGNQLLLGACYLVMAVLVARVIGFNAALLKHEWVMVKAIIGRR